MSNKRSLAVDDIVWEDLKSMPKGLSVEETTNRLFELHRNRQRNIKLKKLIDE